MKYKFHSWEYIVSSGITIAWAKEHDINFDHKDDNGFYAILNEYQAMRVRFQDGTITLIPIPEDEE
jgi:hypothetical protein